MSVAPAPTPSEAAWSHIISEDNHGALVLVATSLMLVGMLMTLAMRVAIRWPWRELVGLDDILIVIASVRSSSASAYAHVLIAERPQVFAVSQGVAMFEAVHHGWAQRI